MASTNSEVLERLLIEVVGDDSKLKAALEDTIKTARRAAEEMRDALKFDFTRVATGAKEVGTALDTAATDVGGFGKALETQLKAGEKAFERFRKSGEMTTEEFEVYRRGILESINVSRPFASTLGITEKTLDDLAKRVKEATYEQKKFEDQTERTEQEQEELADTIKRLSNEVRGSRNVWAGRITSDDEFRQSTGAAREELLKLLPTVDRGSTEYRKLSQELAYAQRGLDSVNKVASRGGLAWTAQIALANQFGQQLRGLGPAGAAAAGGLGLISNGFASLQAPITMADLSLNKIAGTLLRLPGLIGLASGALMVGLGVALARVTTRAAQYAQELENATHRTGLTIEGLQELQHAARSVGVPMELLSTTMQRLQRRAADANAGNAGLQQAFAQLGVTLTDNEGKMRTTEDLLGQVADGLNAVENDADRVALAFKVFDTEGGRLLPLLARGAEGIKELREEARELGLVISGDTILSLSQFQAELETVKQQFEVLRVETAAAFLPVFRDVLLPLIRDQLVPWFGNVARRLNDMADAFFDAGSEGDAFRAKLAQIAARIQSVGQFLYSLGQISVGLVQVLVSPFAALGVAIGNASIGLEALIDAYRRLFSGDFSVLLQSPAQVMREAGAGAERAIDALVEQAQLGLDNLTVGGGLFIGAFDFAALEAEWLARLESAAEGAAERAAPAARQALRELMEEGATEGLGDVAPAGSIAAAEATVQQYAKAFRLASTDEARATAAELRDEWQAVVDAMLAPFQKEEATAAAKLWTDRLTAELRAGVKEPIEVFNLLTQGIQSAEERLEKARLEFGFDSEQYRAALAGLQFLESWLTNFQREYATEPITVTITAEVAPIQGVLPDLTLPEQSKTAAQALVEYYSRLTRVADQQAKLTGATEDTRAAYLETLDILEAILPGLDEMSDDWLAVTALILQARTRVEELNEELDGTTDATSGLAGLFRAAAEAAKDLWESATGSDLASELRGVAGAIGSVLNVTRGARQGQLLAAFLGEDFDATATEIGLLEAEVRGLVERYDDLSAAERVRLTLASNRLKALKDQQQAEADAADAVADHTAALEDWLTAVAKIGVSEDPLLTRARQLEAWLAEGTISLEEYTALLGELAAAQDRLRSGLDTDAFDAWAQSVGRLGVELDPVDLALAELGQLMAAGKITAEEYAAGIDLVNAAMDRLGESGGGGAENIDAIKSAWESAQAAVDEFLGQGPTQFDELRDAAQEAFDAGVIGAQELAAALRAIGVMEVVQGLRDLGSELGGTQGIIPTLAADLTQAAAQLGAGNTAAGIATAFNAATAAVQGLSAAFEDTEHRAEAMVDLVIGGASAIATAIGGPALGQAVAAAGNFIKSILGDLSNGLAAIEKEINATAARSRYLGENLVRGIAEDSTNTVSRGGLLGLLGFTKQELDDDAFRAGISVAEGLASGLVNTLRSGDFEEAWQSFIDDIIINGIIEAFIATALVQNAIEEAMELIMGGDAAGGAATLDRLKNDFRQVWETIQGITSTPLPSQDDLERSVTFSLPDATVSVLAAPQWALELQRASENMTQAGAAMLTAADVIQDVFDRGLPPVETTSSRGIDAARSL